jgi:hypothetical protein
MSKRNRNNGRTASRTAVTSILEAEDRGPRVRPEVKAITARLRERLWLLGVIGVFALGAIGATFKYLEDDAKREKLRPGNDRSLLSSVNPFVPAPLPSPTLQLAKEYIYAGSRLLAVEDVNASAAPPADLAVWRPSSGVWYVLGGPGSQQVTQTWGVSGDVAAPGDYDGDGKTDFSIMRPGATAGAANHWWVIHSGSLAMIDFAFGVKDDLAAPADFDGDGRTDFAVYKPSTGVWYIQGSTVGQYSVSWGGQASDVPVPADYDGDGKADVAVHRGSDTSFWVVASGNSAMSTYGVGQAGAPVPADYDGDGRADPAVFDAASGYWYVRKTTTPGIIWTSPTWGQTGDVPVPNDYDADGRCDLAVWRPGTTAVWYIVNSHDSSYRTVGWGQTGDIPVPAYYRR